MPLFHFALAPVIGSGCRKHPAEAAPATRRTRPWAVVTLGGAGAVLRVHIEPPSSRWASSRHRHPGRERVPGCERGYRAWQMRAGFAITCGIVAVSHSRRRSCQVEQAAFRGGEQQRRVRPGGNRSSAATPRQEAEPGGCGVFPISTASPSDGAANVDQAGGRRRRGAPVSTPRAKTGGGGRDRAAARAGLSSAAIASSSANVSGRGGQRPGNHAWNPLARVSTR